AARAGEGGVRDRGGEAGGVVRRAAARHRPGLAIVALELAQLEVALTRVGDLDDQLERARQERLELGLLAELEDAQIEVALLLDARELLGSAVDRRHRVPVKTR